MQIAFFSSLAFWPGIMCFQWANICCSIKAKCKVVVVCVYRPVICYSIRSAYQLRLYELALEMR